MKNFSGLPTQIQRTGDVCSDMLYMFYHTVIASALFHAVVFWESVTTDINCRCVDKLVNKASSVQGRGLPPSQYCGGAADEEKAVSKESLTTFVQGPEFFLEKSTSLSQMVLLP